MLSRAVKGCAAFALVERSATEVQERGVILRAQWGWGMKSLEVKGKVVEGYALKIEVALP